MPFVYGDRVKESSLSGGIGPMTLGGATLGFVAFAAGVGVGNECFYGIVDTTGTGDWEMGRGTLGAGTFSRDTVFSSSNSDLIVPFTVGTSKLVYTTVPKSFFEGALDSGKHEIIDHTVGPLNLLNATGHSGIDHTVAPFFLMDTTGHENIDHTAAPFNLLNTAGHEAIVHTDPPLSLLDSAAHSLVDHTVGPLFLLDTTAHLAVDHTLALNNNPTQVSAPEILSGSSTLLRSWAPEDIVAMAQQHAGGGGAPVQTQIFTLSYATEAAVKTTGPIPFTATSAIFLGAMNRGGSGSISIGFATGIGSQVGVAQSSEVATDGNDDPSVYDLARVIGATVNFGGTPLFTDFASFGTANGFAVTKWNDALDGIEITHANANTVSGRIFVLVIGQ